MLRKPQERVAGLREGLNATVRIILFGLAMDVIYQVMVFKTFNPVEALIIALLMRLYRTCSSEGWFYARGAVAH